MSVGAVHNQQYLEAADRYRNLGCGCAAVLCFAGLIALSAAPLVQRNWQLWGLAQQRATVISRTLYAVGPWLILMGAVGACCLNQAGGQLPHAEPEADASLDEGIEEPVAVEPPGIHVEQPPSRYVPLVERPPAAYVSVADIVRFEDTDGLHQVHDLAVSNAISTDVQIASAVSISASTQIAAADSRGGLTVDALNALTEESGQGCALLTRIAREMVHEDRRFAAQEAYARLCDRRFNESHPRLRCAEELTLANEVMKSLGLDEANPFFDWQVPRLVAQYISANGGAIGAVSDLSKHRLRRELSPIYSGVQQMCSRQMLQGAMVRGLAFQEGREVDPILAARLIPQPERVHG
jgi:hypothetical protein